MEAPVDPLLGSIGGAEITGLDEVQQDQCDDHPQQLALSILHRIL